MAQLNSPLDILKILPKTNCRDCGEATCMVFAVAVKQGKKKLNQCPHLGDDLLSQFQVEADSVNQGEEDFLRKLNQQRAKIKEIDDLLGRAEPMGAEIKNGKLAVKVLGKEFLLDKDANMASQCHMNLWVQRPILDYAVFCQGVEPTGKWVSMRDLGKDGAEWANFFSKRCEEPLKKLADDYTDLFEFMVEIFNAKRAQEFDADIAVELRPLPKVPMLICYWREDGEMGSQLNLFFDEVTPKNLPVDCIFTLCTGMMIMFEKIAQTHGK
ncbi:hypothetical protein AAU61_10075 [Desulfocarbo indianensis]|nr:hypothetical protein AAU61_10075 [Desulfocarbo indianensis]